MHKTSSVYTARLLAALLKKHGCTQVVISPGSRNAPIINALAADEDYDLYAVPDERVAGFTALGLTLARNEPVAVVCTSGSAAANYFPAVTEAFYQQAPLIVLTADRPKEMVDQGVGQTIQQENIYGRHVVYDVALQRDTGDSLAQEYNAREINRALLASAKGPVHLNVPFAEPFYGREPLDENPAAIPYIPARKPRPANLPEGHWHELAQKWNKAGRIWIIAGMMKPRPHLAKAIAQLQQQSPFVLLTETTANIPDTEAIAGIDRFINTLSERQKEEWRPDLVITLGGEVISKMVKRFVQGSNAPAHWQIAEQEPPMDAYHNLQEYLPVAPENFFTEMARRVAPRKADYRNQLLAAHHRKGRLTEQYVKEIAFSDLQAFDSIAKALPPKAILHCGNSASIRYAQLLNQHKLAYHHSNRGTSGIDGCTSTAIGHAMGTDKPVVLITGEVAFNYDSNAFWNDRLPANFRCLVLNNGGGNIFRIIAGPEKDAAFERFQETPHHLHLQGIAAVYNIPYLAVNDASALQEALPDFLDVKDSTGPQILEVQTPRLENPRVLAGFFEYLREH